MRVIHKLLFPLMIVFVSVSGTFAQTPLPYFTYNKGLGITPPDSSFSINLRFRMQNRIGFTTQSETDLAIREVEARIRRLRLRIDGFVYSPKLTYTVQLSFSRGDLDFETTAFPNVIRDAYVQYAINKTFSVGMGQTKLPGNRQRVTSSGDLQLPDRSIVNAAFNLDRDFGVQFAMRREFFTFRGAITTGEGRNSSSSDKGLSYTGRIEILPFGNFSKGSDYFEGDITRESSPKLSLGIVSHTNENASRSGGQTGNLLYAKRTLSSQFIDLLFKYNGWAVSGEYLTRASGNPVTEDQQGNTRYAYVGHGENYQLSYVFKSNFELVGRYSTVTPAKKIEIFEKQKEQFSLGANKYLKGHRVKMQGEITLEQWSQATTDTSGRFWIYRLQIELGI